MSSNTGRLSGRVPVRGLVVGGGRGLWGVRREKELEEDVRGWFWLWPSGTGVSMNQLALLVLERILVVVFKCSFLPLQAY